MGGVALGLGLPTVAVAAPDPETAYIFNSLSFLMHGFLVMFMAAGFCMLEAGLVRSKNVTVQVTKNIGPVCSCGADLLAGGLQFDVS